MSSSRKQPSAASRIDELVDELNRHGRLYYLEDHPEISDAEYDALYRELVALEAENHVFFVIVRRGRLGAGSAVSSLERAASKMRIAAPTPAKPRNAIQA